MAHFLYWEPNGVYAKFFGTCTVDDVFQAYEKISLNSHLFDLRHAIFDYLDVEQQDITESGILKVAALDIGWAYYFPSLRFASVATDKHVLDLWRIFFNMVKIPGRHGVFPTVSAARDWLAVSHPPPNFLRSSGLL